ncbi:MAG: tripartite tricarboxylate transporter TctB family protein [Nocardioidaceae bacterium]
MSTPKVSAGGLLSTRLLFLYALTVLAGAYTVMAFGMEMRSEGGQIGPGFFPRIVGLAMLLGLSFAIVRAVGGGQTSAEAPVDEEGQPEEVGGDGGTDPRAVLAAVASMALFYFMFEPLGALLASVLLLAGMLTFVNRGHHVANAILSVSVPLGLYLMFEVLLGVGLPEGLVSF